MNFKIGEQGEYTNEEYLDYLNSLQYCVERDLLSFDKITPPILALAKHREISIEDLIAKKKIDLNKLLLEVITKIDDHVK